jgi:glycyl-tRNA synthetase
MFKTFQGVLEDENTTLYLRPETCQNIFVDFMSIARTSRLKLPFSVCQIGKSFRNEITPGNFIFRTREFEQAEMEYFTNPSDSLEEFDELLEKVKMFLFNTLQMNEANFKYYDVKKTELAHYSKKTIDIEYDFPHGYSEL